MYLWSWSVDIITSDGCQCKYQWQDENNQSGDYETQDTRISNKRKVNQKHKDLKIYILPWRIKTECFKMIWPNICIICAN